MGASGPVWPAAQRGSWGRGQNEPDGTFRGRLPFTVQQGWGAASTASPAVGTTGLWCRRERAWLPLPCRHQQLPRWPGPSREAGGSGSRAPGSNPSWRSGGATLTSRASVFHLWPGERGRERAPRSLRVESHLGGKETNQGHTGQWSLDRGLQAAPGGRAGRPTPVDLPSPDALAPRGQVGASKVERLRHVVSLRGGCKAGRWVPPERDVAQRSHGWPFTQRP